MINRGWNPRTREPIGLATPKGVELRKRLILASTSLKDLTSITPGKRSAAWGIQEQKAFA